MASGDTSFGRCESMAADVYQGEEDRREQRENWKGGDGRQMSSSSWSSSSGVDGLI